MNTIMQEIKIRNQQRFYRGMAVGIWLALWAMTAGVMATKIL